MMLYVASCHVVMSLLPYLTSSLRIYVFIYLFIQCARALLFYYLFIYLLAHSFFWYHQRFFEYLGSISSVLSFTDCAVLYCTVLHCTALHLGVLLWFLLFESVKSALQFSLTFVFIFLKIWMQRQRTRQRVQRQASSRSCCYSPCCTLKMLPSRVCRLQQILACCIGERSFLRLIWQF